MKPLWLVDVTTYTNIPIVAETKDEAIKIAQENFDEIKDAFNADSSFAANIMTSSELRWHKDSYPYGIDEYIFCKEYFEKYQQYLKEEQRKKELEEKQGKLF